VLGNGGKGRSQLSLLPVLTVALPLPLTSPSFSSSHLHNYVRGKKKLLFTRQSVSQDEILSYATSQLRLAGPATRTKAGSAQPELCCRYPPPSLFYDYYHSTRDLRSHLHFHLFFLLVFLFVLLQVSSNHLLRRRASDFFLSVSNAAGRTGADQSIFRDDFTRTTWTKSSSGPPPSQKQKTQTHSSTHTRRHKSQQWGSWRSRRSR
jgi:hypothetical protein